MALIKQYQPQNRCVLRSNQALSDLYKQLYSTSFSSQEASLILRNNIPRFIVQFKGAFLEFHCSPHQ